MQDLNELKHVLFVLNLKYKKTSVSSFYKENNFKPCLTKQLLNMFKLWCRRGIRNKVKHDLWINISEKNYFYTLLILLCRGKKGLG